IVLSIGLRDEAIICGIEDGRMNDTVDSQESSLLVELVLDVGTQRNFDYRLKISRQLFSRRNIVPSVYHIRFLRSGLINHFFPDSLALQDQFYQFARRTFAADRFGDVMGGQLDFECSISYGGRKAYSPH